METTTLSIDTTFAKIIRLTFEAAASKVTQKFIQRFSKFYTLA
jgi:Cd2+/Zn2+-exporting ATPase